MSKQEEMYPCADCGKLRTKAEGGTIFTVCDECWDKHYSSEPTKIIAELESGLTADMTPPSLDERREYGSNSNTTREKCWY